MEEKHTRPTRTSVQFWTFKIKWFKLGQSKRVFQNCTNVRGYGFLLVRTRLPRMKTAFCGQFLRLCGQRIKILSLHGRNGTLDKVIHPEMDRPPRGRIWTANHENSLSVNGVKRPDRLTKSVHGGLFWTLECSLSVCLALMEHRKIELYLPLPNRSRKFCYHC